MCLALQVALQRERSGLRKMKLRAAHSDLRHSAAMSSSGAGKTGARLGSQGSRVLASEGASQVCLGCCCVFWRLQTRQDEVAEEPSKQASKQTTGSAEWPLLGLRCVCRQSPETCTSSQRGGLSLGFPASNLHKDAANVRRRRPISAESKG